MENEGSFRSHSGGQGGLPRSQAGLPGLSSYAGPLNSGSAAMPPGWLPEHHRPCSCPGRSKQGFGREEGSPVPPLTLTKVRGGSSGLGMGGAGDKPVFLRFRAKIRTAAKEAWGAGVLVAESNLNMKGQFSHIDELEQRRVFSPCSHHLEVEGKTPFPVPCTGTSGLRPDARGLSRNLNLQRMRERETAGQGQFPGRTREALLVVRAACGGWAGSTRLFRRFVGWVCRLGAQNHPPSQWDLLDFEQ